MSSKKTQIYWANDQVAFYLSPEVQSHHVFALMLDILKRADETIISSFAITEIWVRMLIRKKLQLGHISVFLDYTVASRNPANTHFAAQNIDELLLTNNHSKSIYMRNHSDEMLAIMSNNATSNHRYESGCIFKNHPVIEIYKKELQTMKQQSAPWMS
jgi:hypothetical protein